MTYEQAIDYLYSHLPMFSRIGPAALKKDLTNTLKLCAGLGAPQDKFKSIHVGGTNGKGSVSHMLAAILQTAGYKTGLYTSPHLRDFRERIRVNGNMIAEEEVVRFVDDQQTMIDETEPSFFEMTVAMAFNHFAEQQVDIAIIEVGLGGRLDSTNVIHPLLSVITNIGYDHVHILGDTLEQIAYEKAGIIKKGTPVIVGEKRRETEPVFSRKAAEAGAELIFAEDEWNIRLDDTGQYSPELLKLNASAVAGTKAGRSAFPLSVCLDLTGLYQTKNIKTVLSIVKQLRLQGFTISDAHLTIALANVKQLTGLMGRWQILRKDPLVICDTGHNEDGIREVMKNIRSIPYKHLHMVIGMVKDKDISKVLRLLPAEASFYFCAPAIERAKPAGELAKESERAGLRGNHYPSVKAALAQAISQAGKDDLVFVGGSTFVVAEIV